MIAFVTAIVHWLGRSVVALLLIVLSLVVADFALHGAARVSPRVAQLTEFIEAKIPDARLGHRPNPAYPGHDARGFRNPVAPARADIVALGDSQTYGSGVASADAWPLVLGELSGRAVYNMALGGWGPAHGLLLWDEAMELKPAIVIDAIYAGNDLHDAFSLVYVQNRARELRNPDPRAVEAVMAAEKAEPLHRRISRIYRRGRVRPPDHPLRVWLEENSRVVGLLKRMQVELKQWRTRNVPDPPPARKWRDAREFAADYPAYAQAIAAEKGRTVFTPAYRLTALDLDDPRIREGQRIVYESLDRMKDLAARDGVRFIVLLIPTKELVFHELAASLEDESYRELVEHETRFWDETRRFLESRSIETIDGLDALRRQLDRGPQPYWVSHNGHPNETGQHALARAVNDYLQRPQAERVSGNSNSASGRGSATR